MIGDSISIFASIGRLPIELWLLQCCLKQPPIIDSSTKFENRPFPDKKLAHVPYTNYLLVFIPPSAPSSGSDSPSVYAPF